MKKSISGNVAARILTSYSMSGMKLAAASLLLIGGLSSCIGDDPAVVSDIQEEFTNIKSVTVNGAFLDVSYVGDTSTEVLKLDAFLKANSNSRSKINYQVNGDKLVIEVKYESVRRSEGSIMLAGPTNIALDLNASSGNLFIDKISEGNIKLNTNSGKIHIKNISASEISLNSSSGEVLGEDLIGKVYSSYSSGKVKLHRVNGNISAECSSGNLLVTDLVGKIDAKVSSGKIELERVTELGKLAASSGSISARQSGLGSNTVLTASSGTISIQTNSVLNHFNYDLSASSGSVKIGDTTSPGTLKINNGAAHTVKGLVGSGKIHIVN